MERGDFDDLPGAGKPIKDLGEAHDPNWWIKKLVEREHVAVLPPSLALRKEDAELDGTLDRLTSRPRCAAHLEDFNERVVAARYRLPEGPPLVTMPRDVDERSRAGGSAVRRGSRPARGRAARRSPSRPLAEQRAEPRRRGPGRQEPAGPVELGAPGWRCGRPAVRSVIPRRHRRCYLPAMSGLHAAPRTSSARSPSGRPTPPRDPGPAQPGDPLLRPEQREDGREGPGAWSAPSTCCSATSRTPSRPTTRTPPARGW